MNRVPRSKTASIGSSQIKILESKKGEIGYVPPPPLKNSEHWLVSNQNPRSQKRGRSDMNRLPPPKTASIGSSQIKILESKKGEIGYEPPPPLKNSEHWLVSNQNPRIQKGGRSDMNSLSLSKTARSA